MQVLSQEKVAQERRVEQLCYPTICLSKLSFLVISAGALCSAQSPSKDLRVRSTGLGNFDGFPQSQILSRTSEINISLSSRALSHFLI